jgi:hypothetical protein
MVIYDKALPEYGEKTLFEWKTQALVWHGSLKKVLHQIFSFNQDIVCDVPTEEQTYLLETLHLDLPIRFGRMPE